MSENTQKYASVVLPLAIPITYTYAIPTALSKKVVFGIRVEVSVRNKIYAGIVVSIQNQTSGDIKPKNILSVIDDEPIIHPYQYEFWVWLADYYCCTIGEVMYVALPGGLRLSSETSLLLSSEYTDGSTDLSDDEYLITEALVIRGEITIQEAKDILGRKTVYPLVRDLIDKGMIVLKEKLIPKYKPKKIGFARLNPVYNDANTLSEAFELIKRSNHQTNALLSYLSLSRSSKEVPRSSIYEMTGVSISVLRALEKKGILDLYDKELSRIILEDSEGELPPLSQEQSHAISNIKTAFAANKPCLLHGITGSGKTRVYMDLIKDTIQKGRQVLYLLPEIALTTQIVSRLQFIFGEDVVVYHSRMNAHERVELWQEVLIGKKIILAARSGILLPFSNLGLIIVDEEHDPSFKQSDPNPRYNARDCALVLAKKVNANIILGSATPSIESYKNALDGKYTLIQLHQRYSTAPLPAIEIVNMGYARKTGKINGVFSTHLLNAIKDALLLKQQIILFQNRRGYSPILQCIDCGWKKQCTNCDVTLTYHKYFDEIRCHYCGYRVKNPHKCPECGSIELKEIGIGTERIEDEITKIFPEASVSRMDYDTTRTKNAFLKILDDFGAREIDILIGTQMVTKGLDFDNIGLVGIINADSILRYADFRAGERGFQLMTQVGGRAGRRKKQGKVIIQTYEPNHPVLLEVLNHNYLKMYHREVTERKHFFYPPFVRLIYLQLKHKKNEVAADAANYVAHELKKVFGNRIIGPAQPAIARVKGYYRWNIVIKIEKKAMRIRQVKETILEVRNRLKISDGFKSVIIKIDVDPY